MPGPSHLASSISCKPSRSRTLKIAVEPKMDAKSNSHIASIVLIATMTAARAQAGNDEFVNFPWIPYDHSAIQYLQQTPNDPVGRLTEGYGFRQDKAQVRPQAGLLA